ncbi:serine/threonine-protein kinase [Actinacidiphila yeochonensis]|uniref:serine/threonine-protein kinase n=1 Tax=Actinacidiphila yeochonensis TaxID=89050 RepID=UPI000562E567|nr:serine/threonine-protein kinase [Actinacidiphila yeochonensis]
MSEVEDSEGRLLADRYRLEDVLGKGGMGTVWRAVDETLGRRVAVKELRLTGDVDDNEKQRMITRTLREAKATARIRNTGAITVYDVVREDDRPWIVMELIEGRSLADVVQDDGPVTPRRAAEIGLVILDVLKAAHAEGILHRDVKPSNVLLAGDGPGGRVVLGDFGIAQIDGDPSVTSTGMLVGAPSYISPERARGQKPGPPADMWSLGALLYAAVEGHPPYDKNSAIATLTAVMTEPVGPMPNAGPLAEVITGLLVKDPERRLDEPGARRLLSALLAAPEAPAAGGATAALAPSAGPEDRAALTTGPSAPRDADSGTAGATAAAAPSGGTSGAAGPSLDAVRAREALRSLRNASAGPAKGTPVRSERAPEHGTPGGSTAPPRAPLTDVLPRRTLLLLAAAVVIALIGTVIGVAVAHSGGGSKDSKDNGAPASSVPAGGTAKDTGDAGNTASSSTTPATTAPSTTPATTAPATTASPSGASDTAVPAGWYLYHDQINGFSIALPDGWKRVGNNGYDTGSKLEGPGDTSLLVDWNDTPGPSALGAWKTASAAASGSMDDYHLLHLANVDYRGYDAADWEYERLQGGKAGKQVHVLNRGMVTDPKHGYAIMFTTPAGEWGSAANQRALKTFFATFKPAK